MTFTIQYIREHKGILLMQAFFACVFAAAFYLYHLPLEAVLYPVCICAVCGGVFGGRAVCSAYEKHKRLVKLKSVHRSILPDAFEEEKAGIWERDYQQIIAGLCRELQSGEDEAVKSRREMTDYFTVWVHQIKTPIASMRLHLEAEDTRLARRLKSELRRIEQYVEMVLTYFRMGSDSSDYVFCEVSLDKVLRESIRKLRGDFIMKGLELDYTPLEKTVVSDEKWLSFVVEQILSNALKYTGAGRVAIWSEASGTLCISDTGIGIAPEDIPRIFEKGYTGGNGRTDKRASGLGLYLCRQICGRLGVELSIDSEPEKGTTVRLRFDEEL